MIFNQFCVLTIFLGIFCNIQFIICNCFKPKSSENFDDAEELEEALKLETGCQKYNYEKVSHVNLEEFKNTLIKENNKKIQIKLHNRAHVIYYKLYCGHLYYFLKYMKLSERFIPYELSKILYYNHFIAKEVIQRILSVMLKSKLEAPLDSLWNMYMYAIYIKKEYEKQNKNSSGFQTNLFRIIEYIKENLNLLTDQYCQKDENYYATKLGDLNKVNRSSEIIKVVHVINNRMNNNSFFLDKEENWVSLSSIYLKDIFENSDILKTMIQFGDQTQENCDKIFKNIQNAYKDAQNYFWFDSWILNIYNYQKKIFNILSVVALHLMRKHLMYLLFDQNNTVIKLCNSEMHNVLLNNVTLNNLFKIENIFFSSIISLFLKEPIFFCGFYLDSSYNVINSDNIEVIECKIRNNCFDESFEILQIRVDDPEYIKNSIHKTKTFKSGIKLSEEKEKNIKKFESISRIEGLNDNFLRFNIFLEYLENLFQSVNVSTIQSFMEFSSKYNIVEINQWNKKKEEDKLYISF